LVNELLITELSKSFPEDGIIGEEKSTTEYGVGIK
jgi:fructose-1,6-bisphosphatase/inositol monophosphatase family enzyme